MKNILLAFLLTTLVGCTTTNDAFIAAHKSNEVRAIAEAASQAKVDSDAALAMNSAIRKCTSDICVLSLAVIANSKQVQPKQTQPLSMTPPPNEITEFVKAVGSIVAPIYGTWAGTVSSIVNSTRGAADSGTASTALNVLTPKIN
jgi:hypothetical protein